MTTTPCYISLNRLACLSGRSRVTLLLRLKDGKLSPDAALDLGNGQVLPLFLPTRGEHLRASPKAGPKQQLREHPKPLPRTPVNWSYIS